MKIKLLGITSLLVVLQVMSANNSSADTKVNKLNESMHRSDIIDLGYSSFEPLNIDELDETKGKVGPLILGVIAAAGGAGASIGIDYSNGQTINWGNAATAGVAGFVTGISGGLLGGTISGAAASAALGASAAGASHAAIGRYGGGGCNACHNINK